MFPVKPSLKSLKVLVEVSMFENPNLSQFGLDEMEQYKNEASVSAFVLAAKKVLNQRIEHSPSKTDSKYRKEWFKRLDSYLNP